LDNLNWERGINSDEEKKPKKKRVQKPKALIDLNVIKTKNKLIPLIKNSEVYDEFDN